MASVINQRTISSETDNRIVLQNSNFARLVPIGTSWNSVRVAIRYAGNNTGANIAGTPRLAVGLCAGTSNIFLDASTTHWVGALTNLATWTWHAASGGNMAYYGANWAAAKKIGSTITIGGTMSTCSITADATTTTRRFMFVDIIKGSPNYTINGFYPAGVNVAAAPDVLYTDWLSQFDVASPSFTNHTYNSGTTLAVDEATDGTLNAVNVAWNQLTPTIEICDVAVLRLS